MSAGPPDAEVEVVPVVVVGAGPTGLTAAILLAGRGIRSLVLERFTEPYPLPRAVHLDDEVVRILQAVGVADAFAAISRPALGLRLVDAQLRVLAEFGRADPHGVHGYPQANMFDQPDLEALLRDRLAGCPEVELRSGMQVLTIEQPADGPAPVRVTYRDEQARRRVVWAGALLGCDGANSVTRQQIGAELLDLHFTEEWVVVDVRSHVQLATWDGVHQVCDPHRAATYMQVGPDRYRWEFRLRAGETLAELSDPATLAALLAPWTPGIPATALEVLRCSAYTFKARLADRWRLGRVFLLGDAAHLTPPFIGQGLAAGLRDAYNLAWKLALVVSRAEDDRLLDTYQAERKPHARAMIRLAVLTGWAMTGGQDRAAAVRRRALAVLCRMPGFTDLVGRGTSPRLGRGMLVRRGHRLRHLAGTICPQPWVEPGHRRLDDALGPGFAVLADGPLDPTFAEWARRFGARVVQVREGTTGADETITGSAAVTMRRWLSRAGAGAVLIRPDRVVLQQSPTSVTRRGR